MCYISLSFDDSRRDFYSNVFPLLKKYNVPATLNVITNRVKKTNAEDNNRIYMTELEVKELAESGLVEIASHSSNHRNEVEDVITSVKYITNCNSISCAWGGGYASPFSELNEGNLIEKGFAELLDRGVLKYIRSGTRTKEGGLVYASIHYVNEWIKSPMLFRVLNKKFVFTNLTLPFITSVAIHYDTTFKMLSHFVQSMNDNENVVFCLHGILRPNENGYGKRFNWDYYRFEQFLRFLIDDKSCKLMFTAELVNKTLLIDKV